MKRTFKLIVNLSSASLLTLSALSQDALNNSLIKVPSPPESSHQPMSADRLSHAVKASELIGMEVKNYQGDALGKIDDLAVDVESGRIVHVILSHGGFVGFGNTLHAVPPGALHHDVAHKVVHLDVDKEKFNASPRFEMSKWAECCDSNHVDAVYRHYGEKLRFTFGRRGDAPQVVSKPILNEDEPNAHWSSLGYVQRASKLMGASVINLQNEKLGKVENMILDLSAGRMMAVIISTGGFLGMGDELSAVPSTALRSSQDRDTLQLDVSKEALSNAPHFKANEWPDMDQPNYANGVYRAYKLEPYFGSNTVSGADNTARNARDRDARTLTPLDQGSSQADVNTTAQIRKEIVAGKEMSVNAKNVKIITSNGRVTLRGPVDTAEEKRLIGVIAIDIAQVANVDNQLEVK